jgi:hypothetical protein
VKLEEAIGRPGRHLIEDGVVEMTMGVQFFLAGVMVWFGHFFVWYWIAACFLSGWVIRILKKRVIAPRAGYVVPREEEIEVRISPSGLKLDSTSRRYAIVIGALVLWTLGLLVMIPNRMFPQVPERWRGAIGVWSGMLVAAWFVSIAVRYKSSRYFWLAALALGLGVWTYGRHGDPIGNLLLMMTCLSGAWALLGAMQLRKFLRENPRA